MRRFVIRTLVPSLLFALGVACLVTISGAYRKPHIPPSVEIIRGIAFHEGDPGDTVYNESAIKLQAYDMFVNLQIRSSDLKGPGAFTICVSNLSGSCDNITFVSLGNDYKTVWRYLQPGTYEMQIYWKLDIPIPCVAGKYNFTYSVKLIDAREGEFFDQFLLCLHIIEYEFPIFIGLLFGSFSFFLVLTEKARGQRENDRSIFSAQRALYDSSLPSIRMPTKKFDGTIDGKPVKVDGEIKFTVCLTTSDIKTLGKAPRVYNDINGLNNGFLFTSEKRLFKRGNF